MSDFDFVQDDASDGFYGSCNVMRRFRGKKLATIRGGALVKGRTGRRAAGLP
jgi:hypothetical protein